MFEVSVRTEIEAPIETTWATLAQLDDYKAWNPVIQLVTSRDKRRHDTDLAPETGVHLDGPVQPGDPITIHVALRPDTLYPINVTVSRVARERELGWKFFERARWLYRGEHVWRLEVLDTNRTLLVDTERFWGALVPLRRSKLGPRITGSMTQMGTALKRHVERTSPVS